MDTPTEHDLQDDQRPKEYFPLIALVCAVILFHAGMAFPLLGIPLLLIVLGFSVNLNFVRRFKRRRRLRNQPIPSARLNDL